MSLSLPKLDPKEEHFCIASCIEGLTLFLRYMPPNAHQTGTPKIVLYVHGGSFPSALSIAHRFDGRSWRDELADRYDTKVQTAMRVDVAAEDAILKEARRGKYDLTILGVTRRPGETLSFGNMAAAVLESSDMSILFVAS